MSGPPELDGRGDIAAHAGFDPVLRIDWVSAADFGDGLPGRFGLTFLPGKRGVSTRYPGRAYARDVDTDLIAMRRAGARRLLLLVEDAELERWGDRHIVERGVACGVEVLRFPIPDGSPPASVSEMRTILDSIREGRGVGDVAVACMGGVGRTGTVAACALVEAGMDASTAIAMVRSVRHPQAVETAGQEQFVAAFAASVR